VATEKTETEEHGVGTAIRMIRQAVGKITRTAKPAASRAATRSVRQICYQFGRLTELHNLITHDLEIISNVTVRTEFLPL